MHIIFDLLGEDYKGFNTWDYKDVMPFIPVVGDEISFDNDKEFQDGGHAHYGTEFVVVKRSINYYREPGYPDDAFIHITVRQLSDAESKHQ